MRRKVLMAKVRAELILRHARLHTPCPLYDGSLGHVILPASGCRPGSARHVLKLGEIERLRPWEAALSEHLKHRLDALRVFQATERDEDRPRKALQVAAEDPGAAIWAEVPIQPFARL